MSSTCWRLVQDDNPEEVEVSELLINSIDIINLRHYEGSDLLDVRIEASMVETAKGVSLYKQRHMVWKFRKKSDVLSLGPERMSTLCCMNCGGNLEIIETGECAHCETLVEPGTLNWELYMITPARRVWDEGPKRFVRSKEVMPEEQFGPRASKFGIDFPSIVDKYLDQEITTFIEKHKLGDPREWSASFGEKVVKPAFIRFYESWEKQSWENARLIVTDNVFRRFYLLLKAYEDAGLVNYLKDLQVQRAELVKIDLDHFFETVTVRVHAICKDYVENQRGRLHAGHRRRRVQFSEYWTFVRRDGVDKDNEEYNTLTCPNCGAPIEVGMTGICGHCDTKVSTGEFGWVLSNIALDESYGG